MAQERKDLHERGTDPAPGDIGRGTQETTTAAPAPGGAPPSQDFAARQSFADPAHRGGKGGLRTQETGSEEGARTPARQAVTTSRKSLESLPGEEGEA